MPHKHKRKRDNDGSQYDLDPAVKAKPLPAYKPPSVFSESSNKRRKAVKSDSNSRTQDDTPKAFARMMAWQATGKRPSGLDDGSSKKVSKSKTGKKISEAEVENSKSGRTKEGSEGDAASTSSKLAGPIHKRPQILPGESLSQFAVRVDQSLPLNSTSQSSAPAPNIPSDIKPQARITKHNKRLQRMISDWRDTDAKIKEKREEEVDDLQEKQEEEDLLWDGVKAATLDRKGKKKHKGKRVLDDDPWKDLAKQRKGETKQKNLQDVVKAPPSLVKVRSKFKMKDEDFIGLNGKQRGSIGDDVGVDVKDVPNAIGSLRRREEVGKRRREVIESYRKLQGTRLKGKGLSHPLPRSIVT